MRTVVQLWSNLSFDELVFDALRIPNKNKNKIKKNCLKSIGYKIVYIQENEYDNQLVTVFSFCSLDVLC